MQSQIDQVTSLIITLGRRIKEKNKAKVHRGFRLSPEQAQVLLFIEDQEVAQMKDVAGHFCITAPSATAIVENLVQAGLIKRMNDKKDRRAVVLEMTKKGKTEVVKARTEITARMKQLLSKLDEKDLKNLVIILKKFSDEEIIKR